MVRVSAPGKVHLIGEHSVVYNQPAIITAVGRRTTVDLEKADNVRYVDRRFNSDATWSLDEVHDATQEAYRLWEAGSVAGNKFGELLAWSKTDGYANYRKAVIGIALKKLGIESGAEVQIDSTVPVGSGLGSSSSLAVCIAKGLGELYGISRDPEGFNQVAYELEKIIHGAPSGGDNSACYYGGLVWFKKAQPRNEIRSLREEVPHALENFVLVYTGQPKLSTGELVQLVRDKPEEYRNPRVEALGAATHEMLNSLKAKDYGGIRRLMNLAQTNLAELGVSTPTIDKIAEAVRGIGGAAKLCGAGGGGIMLTQHDDKNKLSAKIKELGFEPIEVDLGVEGVRIE
jgi:mevalonate kinase